jgi:hypothetical protein
MIGSISTSRSFDEAVSGKNVALQRISSYVAPHRHASIQPLPARPPALRYYPA